MDSIEIEIIIQRHIQWLYHFLFSLPKPVSKQNKEEKHYYNAYSIHFKRRHYSYNKHFQSNSQHFKSSFVSHQSAAPINEQRSRDSKDASPPISGNSTMSDLMVVDYCSLHSPSSNSANCSVSDYRHWRYRWEVRCFPFWSEMHSNWDSSNWAISGSSHSCSSSDFGCWAASEALRDSSHCSSAETEWKEESTGWYCSATDSLAVTATLWVEERLECWTTNWCADWETESGN